MENVHGKVVALTGGGGILCSVMARHLAKHGAKIALLDLVAAKAEATARSIRAENGEAIAFSCDVLQRENVEQVHQKILDHFGHCDALINGAGVNSPRAHTSTPGYQTGPPGQGEKHLGDISAEDFGAVMDLNVLGSLIPSQVFAQQMERRRAGLIVNVSSMGAFLPLLRMPAYGASKACVDNLSRWLAVHLAPAGIRVVAIAPGFIITDLNRQLFLEEDGSYKERARQVLAHTPMGRFGAPEDLVGVILWLLDEKLSGFVTGITIPIDGGFLAYPGV